MSETAAEKAWDEWESGAPAVRASGPQVRAFLAGFAAAAQPRQVDREALMKVLNDAGAYCGECGYEDGYGENGCSQCEQTLAGYADAILESLSPIPATGDVAEVVTLCGSTKFKDAINAENQRLTMEGLLVISLGVFGHTDLPGYDWSTDTSDLKRKLDRLHFQKIDMASRVHVVNPGGYIGDSTRREIDYAESRGKQITYMEVTP